MSGLRSILRDYGWPAIAGLLFAAVVLLSFPQLREREHKTEDEVALAPLSPGAEDEWLGRVSYADAVERAAPSVVNIYTQKRLTEPRHPLWDDPLFRRYFNRYNFPQRQRMEQSLGSGVIVSQDGYILTNNHVVAEADEIIALLHDGREMSAQLVGKDTDTDLAVLKVDARELPPISVGSPASARVGDIVLAIGNPFGVGQSVSQGIISATGRYGLGLSDYENFIQTDAAINPGNSGGALIDVYGNLIGINSAILDRSSNSVGVGFAIPADAAINILEDIVQYGRVIRGWLGVAASPLTKQAASQLGLPNVSGLLITGISKEGPADLAGLQLGDIIVKVDDKWAGGSNLVMRYMASVRPGAEIKLDVVRNGETVSLVAVAGTRPEALSR